MFVLMVHWFYVEQEEALQAFIQPETLDGPNQYFCERCKKKCDARKVIQITDDDCEFLYHISVSYAVFFVSRVCDSSISHTCWLCSWNASTLITPLCTALNSMTAWPSQRSWTWAPSSTSRTRWDRFMLSFLSAHILIESIINELMISSTLFTPIGNIPRCVSSNHLWFVFIKEMVSDCDNLYYEVITWLEMCIWILLTRCCTFKNF